MPDISQLAQDKDFLGASSADQRAYLASVDPDFAKAGSADQEAYRSYVHGEAVKARNAQPTQYEQDHPAPKPYYGFSPGNLYEQGKRGLKELGAGLFGTGKDILSPEGSTEGEKLGFLGKKYIFDPADAEREKARNAPSTAESIGHSIASAIPIVGPWAASLGEQAGTGDVGGAVARGGTQAAAAELSEPVMRGARVGAGMARDAIGTYIRDPTTGNLKPGARAASRLVGGVTGGTIGAATMPHLPYMGGYAGFHAGQILGPSLMDSMFPGTKPEIIGSPKPSEAIGTPIATATSPLGKGFASEEIRGPVGQPNDNLVLTPEQAKAQEQLYRVAKQQAHERGMQYAGGMRPGWKRSGSPVQ